ncbi:hypothetical protein EV421DRAFT_2022985 [Armillaria borealis]|uniref:Uncharacterized protein n=1 Tax=Armillaria borealis TaxID=47425 RepID=A0AA39J365_9AGAR|nr:hypothetical protein EV421DRAFT_2022985 [Armillaria borealis]
MVIWRGYWLRFGEDDERSHPQKQVDSPRDSKKTDGIEFPTKSAYPLDLAHERRSVQGKTNISKNISESQREASIIVDRGKTGLNQNDSGLERSGTWRTNKLQHRFDLNRDVATRTQSRRRRPPSKNDNSHLKDLSKSPEQDEQDGEGLEICWRSVFRQQPSENKAQFILLIRKLPSLGTVDFLDGSVKEWSIRDDREVEAHHIFSTVPTAIYWTEPVAANPYLLDNINSPRRALRNDRLQVEAVFYVLSASLAIHASAISGAP